MNTEEILERRTHNFDKLATVENPSRHEIWRMFDRISGRYDLLNRILSFYQDVKWRKKLAQMLPDHSQQTVLDLATGTADVLLTLFNYSSKINHAVGLDMAQEMLQIGRKKIALQNLQKKIQILPGDAENIPFADNNFDTITIAFGIRNLISIEQGLREIFRVLKPKGRLLVLEFSLPDNRYIKVMYLFYFRKILPKIGSWLSGDRYAYHYLNQTVETFPYGKSFCDVLCTAGFQNIVAHPLTLGLASIYMAEKHI
jgi:demethylmenaquinone methyltransferase/2-methoxy-6-polyprenyl-1,4-benzoquinol methylase